MSDQLQTAEDKAASKIPRHVAIIMDGNGRWAKERGLPRLKGHEEGAESVRAVLRACRNSGVKYLTLYAFSIENWVRPESEVSGLMNLLVRFLKSQEFELHDEKIRFRAMGRLSDLPEAVRNAVSRVTEATKNYDTGHLTLALSYGARAELTDAVRRIADSVKSGAIVPSAIDETTIANNLYLPEIPDPDLLIRTSGEMRISNFLLWQISYAELYVTPTLWPDFREDAFKLAIEDFGRRKRRFGDIKERSAC